MILQKLESPFPYYLNDDRKNTVLSFAVGLFVLVFHLVYRTQGNPGISLNIAQKAMFGGITFAVMFFYVVLVPRMFTFAFLDTTRWTVKKYILHVLCICLTIGSINVFVDKLYVCPQLSWGTVILHVLQQVVLTGITPIAIMTMLLRNNLLQQNLESAINANREIDKIKTLKTDVVKSSNTVTIFSDTSETLTFKLSDLLFIEADDNYSTVIWKNGSGVEKKLLRINLKNIERQLNNSFTIRCHRSYIVNVHAIATISGNANGYKLHIRDSEFAIPVSRPKGREVMEKISQVRNVMESY